MNFITKIKHWIVSKLIDEIDRRFWNIENDDKYCQSKDIAFSPADYERDKEKFSQENRLPFFYFFVECESNYFYQYTIPLLIEPNQGWLINEKTKGLAEKSFPYTTNPFRKRTTYPRLYHFLNPFKKLTAVEEAISVSYGWDNYFHFFIDTLPQLSRLNEYNIPKEIPLIIPATALQFQYVTDFLAANDLINGRPIILQQKNEYIRVKKNTYVFKDISFPKETIVNILHHFKDKSFLSQQGNRKIFLKRSTHKGRSISNTEEVEEFLLSKGYESIDSENMGLQEQIDLFSSTSHLIGIHGAGLTNIIFRYGKMLELTELFPADFAPEHYKILAQMLGYTYRSLKGSDFDSNNQFHVPIESLNKILSS